MPEGQWPTIRNLKVFFYLPFPKSYSKAKREALADTQHEEKPDLDNLIKSFCDCFGEDRQVSKIDAEKRWDDGQGPRTVFFV
jgi:Holliday junction resolvase RusA-like endonuclease